MIQPEALSLRVWGKLPASWLLNAGSFPIFQSLRLGSAMVLEEVQANQCEGIDLGYFFGETHLHDIGSRNLECLYLRLLSYLLLQIRTSTNCKLDFQHNPEMHMGVYL
jgi:hypothetical protein